MTKFTCKCKECVRSSHFGNQCLYEDSEKMAYCHTFRKPKIKKENK